MIRSLSRFIFIVVLSISAIHTFGQSKKVWLYQADYYYEKNDFPSALRLYQMVLDDSLGLSTTVIPYEATLSNQKLKSKKSDTVTAKVDSLKGVIPIKDYVHHQIAMCYRKSKDYERALEHFRISAERGKIPDDYYYVANSIMLMGKYDEAIKAYDYFITLEGTSDELLERALTDMSGCVYAKKAEVDEDITVNIANNEIFNKGTASFAVSYWGGEDKLVFSSAREGSVIIDPEKQDPNYLLDLYYTQRDDKDAEWQEPTNFGRPLNSGRHEASGWFNNGNVIFFTRWSDDDRKYKHLYVARHINMRFFESQKLDSTINFDSSSTINPFVTQDGKWLYYSSDRPGGLGGLDIWRVQISESGLPISEPENLGKPVNSDFDEKTPFFHEKSQTLFFSSDGHKTTGGLDVFKADYDEDAGNFMIPINMGLPINSTQDDAYFVIDDMLRFGYLSSNRTDCTECDSTFKELCASCYKIFNVTLPELEFKIRGYVFDMATGEVIPNASIEFKDISYKWEHFTIQADEKGYYEHDLVPNLELFLRGSHKGYFADKAVVFTKGSTESRIYTQDFYLEKIPEGEITIEGIEYDFNKATLRPESKKILDKLIEFLELNNNLKIEIRSHTDFRGSDSYNQDLSQRRAQSVVDYLIQHGIPMERLVPKGYGESMPAEVPDKNGNVVTLTPEYIKSLSDEELIEEYHQRNRRTAFFVLEEH
ncbi:MAG: OmpA family protein [Crocinitomicaceae bacterium]|nr:OmpA family protein [Crocinitomicaceae bacterium]